MIEYVDASAWLADLMRWEKPRAVYLADLEALLEKATPLL